MQLKELQSQSIPELQLLLAQLRETYRESRFKTFNKQLKNYRQLRAVKKDIARVLTVLNQRRHAKAGRAEDESQAEAKPIKPLSPVSDNNK